MLQEQGGWYVVNVKDANWRGSERFGEVVNFETQGAFTDDGGRRSVLVRAIGQRKDDEHESFYPESEMARKYGAEVPEPTAEMSVAYSDVERPEPLEDVEWPID